MHSISVSQDGYIMPTALQDILRADPRDNPHAQFDSAYAFARAGFPVAQMDEKRPIGGWKTATTDIEAVRDWFLANPDANVGVQGEASKVYGDIDHRNGGTLEIAEAVGIPVDGHRYRTPGGWRVPLLMPYNAGATRSAKIAPGIEIKGPTLGTVVPHSVIDGNWYGIEPGREIWQWGAIPEKWPYLDLLTGGTLTASLLTITAEDVEAARDTEERMRHSTDFGDGIAALFDGAKDWHRHFSTAEDVTESGRDFQLALAGSHFLRDHVRRGEIIYALLEMHSRKAKHHASPEKYLQTVTNGAMASRENRDQNRLTRLNTRFISPHVFPDDKTTTPSYVLDAKFGASELKWGVRGAVMDEVIMGFAASDEVDEFTRDDGWRRFPVQDVADIFGVGRETVRLRLVALESRGAIERRAPANSHDGGHRRDSLVRLVR